MFRPDDALGPRGEVFDEPWHAEVLAMADALVRSGTVQAADWSDALGAALARAEARDAPENDATYYACALEALEGLAVSATDVTQEMMSARKSEWERAYLSTPHGAPVTLTAGQGSEP